MIKLNSTLSFHIIRWWWERHKESVRKDFIFLFFFFGTFFSFQSASRQHKGENSRAFFPPNELLFRVCDCWRWWWKTVLFLFSPFPLPTFPSPLKKPSFKDNTINNNISSSSSDDGQSINISSSSFAFLFRLQINVLNFIIKCDLTSYAQLIYWILLVCVPALMLMLILLWLLMWVMIHVVFHAAFLSKGRAIASNHLKRMWWQERSVNRLKVFWRRWNALRKVSKLGWGKLMHGMMMTKDGWRITLRMNCQRLQIAANVVGHLSVLITLFHCSRLIQARFIALIIYSSED